MTHFVPGYYLPQLRQELEKTLLLGMGAQAAELEQAQYGLHRFVASAEYPSLFESLAERKMP